MTGKIDLVERKLEEKTRELTATPDNRSETVREEIGKLQQTRDKLQKQRSLLDDKLQEGTLLSASEERRWVDS